MIVILITHQYGSLAMTSIAAVTLIISIALLWSKDSYSNHIFQLSLAISVWVILVLNLLRSSSGMGLLPLAPTLITGVGIFTISKLSLTEWKKLLIEDGKIS